MWATKRVWKWLQTYQLTELEAWFLSFLKQLAVFVHENVSGIWLSVTFHMLHWFSYSAAACNYILFSFFFLNISLSVWGYARSSESRKGLIFEVQHRKTREAGVMHFRACSSSPTCFALYFTIDYHILYKTHRHTHTYECAVHKVPPKRETIILSGSLGNEMQWDWCIPT